MTWKHGQAEEDDFSALARLKPDREAAEQFLTFAGKYPDSDYRQLAGVAALLIYMRLTDAGGQLQAGIVLVEVSEALAQARAMGFAALSAVLSPQVTADDAKKQQKLADLSFWVHCGSESLALFSPASGLPVSDFEKSKNYWRSVFERTAGFVALMQKDYSLAMAKLETANSLNPQDALTGLWLAEAKLLAPSPDMSGGVFYLARWVELAPQVANGPEVLKQVYVIVHGSDKGLDGVRATARANTTPPAGFSVLAPAKKKHHYGTAVAATAIIGLLVFEAVYAWKHPAFGAAIGQSVGTASAPKMMIFGGPGHQTYLGCLTCSEYATDSVFNQYGRNGSRYQSESIWNRLGEFGSLYSAYSACNEYATDPPIIVDQDGTAYGRLTVNRYSPYIGAGVRLYAWLTSAVCAN